MNFKNLLFVLCLALCILNCSKADENISGQITGLDARKCNCCGGYVLLIEHIEYYFDGLPADAPFKLDNTTTYPINVKVKFNINSKDCGDFRRISIQTIKKN